MMLFHSLNLLQFHLLNFLRLKSYDAISNSAVSFSQTSSTGETFKQQQWLHVPSYMYIASK